MLRVYGDLYYNIQAHTIAYILVGFRSLTPDKRPDFADNFNHYFICVCIYIL